MGVRALAVCLATTMPTPTSPSRRRPPVCRCPSSIKPAGFFPEPGSRSFPSSPPQRRRFLPQRRRMGALPCSTASPPDATASLRSSPGFEPGRLPDVRIRAGDNGHVVVLTLPKVEQSVTVGRDTQTVAADRRGTAFGNTVTDAESNPLSDDPAELQRQLQDLTGPDAIIRTTVTMAATAA